MQFSYLSRPDYIQKLKSFSFDLLIIGGGVTGAGIALDAISRGLSVGLVEKKDFASGTSGKSTKLIHGGLRYLKQLEIQLVREVGRERTILHNNARHLVIPERMLLPIVENGSISKWSASLGLLVYDFLAGVRPDEHRRMLNKLEVKRVEPLLNDHQLEGGSLYYEYRTDDARLVIELIKTAHQMGAVLLNYTEARHFIYQGNEVAGIQAVDTISNESYQIKAKKVINATGPWVDLIRKKDNTLQGKRLQLTKGIHIVVPHLSLPLKQSVYFDAPDKRMIFAIPRGETTYIGTTDTVYNQDLDHPDVRALDVEYLLNAVNEMFPSAKLSAEKIVSSWAGLRPLIHKEGKSPSELSRKDEIFYAPSGLISIAGGKLTGYRKMAKRVVDIVMKELAKSHQLKYKKCVTKKLKLVGGDFKTERSFKEFTVMMMEQARRLQIQESIMRMWIRRYGTEVKHIIKAVESLPTESKSDPNYLLNCELQYCAQQEMVCTLGDFLIRRTAMLYFQSNKLENKLEGLNEQLNEQLQFSNSHKEQSLLEFKKTFEQIHNFN